MAKDRKPVRKFKADELLAILQAKIDKEEHTVKCCTTDDGTGVRWLMRSEFQSAAARKSAFVEAKILLLEAVAKETT
jgi:3-deoxy-D-manno-octulosonate 8-phosphate phosphatase KdsC-like HAD superfamily phosphatase